MPLFSIGCQNSMPAAAGAVAAAAIADQMLGPKEDRHLAIVLVFSCMSYPKRERGKKKKRSKKEKIFELLISLITCFLFLAFL